MRKFLSFAAKFKLYFIAATILIIIASAGAVISFQHGSPTSSHKVSDTSTTRSDSKSHDITTTLETTTTSITTTTAPLPTIPTTTTPSSSWTLEPIGQIPNSIVGPTYGLYSLTCVSANYCITSGSTKELTVFENGTWQTVNISSSNGSSDVLGSFSCISISFCMAADSAGFAYEFSNNKIVGYQQVYKWNSWDGSGPIGMRVSCASSTFCGAFNTNGDAFIFNGLTWTSATHLTDEVVGFAHELVGISCPVSGYCLIVGRNNMGNPSTFTYQNGPWTANALPSSFDL